MTERMSGPIDVTRSRVFDGLTDRERHACLEPASTVEIKRRQALARQGEPAARFYLVESGLLKLLQNTADGRQLIVRFVGPGEPFGGVVALGPGEYPVTALAVESVRCRAWTQDALANLLDDYPRLRVNIMREVAAHMTDALTRVRELVSERVGQRLAHTLLRLARQSGTPTADGIVLAHPLTRQELAELADTTIYTVSRTLSAWQERGIVRADRRKLILASTRSLEDIAAGLVADAPLAKSLRR